MKTLVIGVAGGTGSGKTTLTRQLAKRFGEDLCVIYHDNYYRCHDELTYDQRCLLNYDHPDAFETDLLVQHLQMLRQELGVYCPVYDFTVHNRSKETLFIPPKPIIIIDGILILQDPHLRDMMDVKIFVDTDADVRILRRIERDMTQRGRSFASVRDQYLSTVKPMHERFVEPSRRNADVVIPEGGRNRVAIEMILLRIRAHIEEVEETLPE